jgi:glycosyltransferase involved in cell wall biosynthesis
MAVKNTARYLPECLDSINQQTYPFWELIAVNDHSTDGSREILAQYAAKDPRIRVFDSPGQRLNPALQEGYRHLQGTLINRMDSDDRMPHDKLETMVQAWLAHGQGAIVAGGTEHFVDSGDVGGGFRRYEQWLNNVARNNLHYQEIYQECTIPSHCWLMHRDDFAAVGAFTDVYPEDYDLAFRIYRQKLKVIGLDKILHHWRDHKVRISRTWEEYKDNRYFELKLKYFYHRS